MLVRLQLARGLTRSLPLTLSLACAASFTLTFSAPRIAHAQGAGQVSDSDRAAARELYIEGVKLQEQGKFADALEKFQRAQSVFSAPTHLLHIAECQAALGHLVESAETYRTLVRTPLPAGSPNAFVQAQQQGSAELTQVEPRIPTLKIQVKPENTQNLSVQFDGQPMSAALVGVPRPANPGEHHIVVFAPGYGKSEQKITLKEKEQKELPIVLQPTSGVVYGPATTLPPAQQPPPYQMMPVQQQPAEQPPVYQQPPPEPKKRGSAFGFMFGPHLGVGVPGGSLSSSDGDSFVGDRKVSNSYGAGGAFGLEAGFRFARVLYLGLAFDHGIYSRGSAIDAVGNHLASGINFTSTNSSNYFGLTFAWISNPEGVGFWGELGAGYRWLSTTLSSQNPADSSADAEVNQTWSGGEGSIGAGVAIRVSSMFRLIPKVVIGGGSFSKIDVSCSSSGNGCSGFTSVNRDITNSDTHTFVFIGMSGMFDLGKKSD
jgi:hypothetical protein